MALPAITIKYSSSGKAAHDAKIKNKCGEMARKTAEE
jgi:hypothetical protein